MWVQDLTPRLADRVAVVTGGAGGIGGAIVERFLLNGAKVVIVDIDMKAAERLQERLLGSGADKQDNMLFVEADVTDADHMERLCAQVLETYGRVDILVHAAGISGRPLGDGPVTACPEPTWEKVIRTNLTSAYLVSKYLLPPMMEARTGSVIHIASDDALAIPPPPHDTHAYIAAKGGVIALTRAMAISYAPYNIRVNAIAPGWIETPMTQDLQADQEGYAALIARHPLGRMGTPGDIAGAALFLAGDDASFITGVVLPVEGGATVW